MKALGKLATYMIVALYYHLAFTPVTMTTMKLKHR